MNLADGKKSKLVQLVKATLDRVQGSVTKGKGVLHLLKTIFKKYPAEVEGLHRAVSDWNVVETGCWTDTVQPSPAHSSDSEAEPAAKKVRRR